ncbi:MAG: ATP-binding cassette domain-containing protein [Bifidobacteriaceae bacterium]|jgi:ABC-type lipoprotein export system ATPase subunit|nr:ATP-binding cassette domain-containing protein [Bifidobacteriaceae bacterium]
MRVDVSHCSVAFGQRVVLSDLSGSFASPGMVAFMGPSGSGKTTLLGVVAGAVRAASGIVAVDGKPGAAGRWEWIVQSSPLLNRRSAYDNVVLGPRARGESARAAAGAAGSALEALGIGGLANQRVYKLSGGERQRVAVARALAAGSELILADEPTASLDPRSRELVCDGLERAAVQGALVLVATHDPYVAGRAGLVYGLEDGRLTGGP